MIIIVKIRRHILFRVVTLLQTIHRERVLRNLTTMTRHFFLSESHYLILQEHACYIWSGTHAITQTNFARELVAGYIAHAMSPVALIKLTYTIG
jgi:hypothetical protein